MIAIPQLSLKDWIIAGLAVLVLLLTLNTYLSISIGPVGFEGWKPKAQRVEASLRTEAAKHEVTKASVEALVAKIADMNQDSIDRADRFKSLEAQAIEDKERLSEAARRSRLRAEKLQALINKPGTTCEASSELLDALEGL